MKELTNFLTRPPRLLWVTPYALHDTTSGAAIQSRTMLNQLVKRGVKIKALGNLNFDAPNGTMLFSSFKNMKESNNKFFYTEDDGIEYIYVHTKDIATGAITNAEQNLFYAKYLQLLNEFKPDLIMAIYAGILSYAFRHEAKRRGVDSVFIICHPSHAGNAFPDESLVLSDSQATALKCRNFNGINVIPMGQFIDPEKIVASDRKPEYVTIINPQPAKGIALVARLMLMAKKELPELKFLSCSSRGNMQWLRELHEPDDKEKKPFKDKEELVKTFTNVVQCDHCSDMRQVYAQTKLLLAPSLWEESWGRVATEATMNGIPVLASKNYGLPEAIGAAGICLPPPQACVNDHLRLPTEEEMRPWFNAMKTLLTNDYSQACAENAKQHSLEYYSDRLYNILLPIFAKRGGDKVKVKYEGYLST